MPFRRTVATRRQGTRGGRKPRARRRTGIRTRVRWQRLTARAQKSQIATIARMAVRNSQILNSQKTYTDWYQIQSNSYGGTSSIGIPLTNLASWVAGARQNLVVDRAQKTFVREMLFNYYVQAPASNNPVYLTMSLVTIRPTAAATPVPSPLVVNADYTTQGQRNAVIWNSSKYHVLFSRFFIMYPANQTPLNPGDEPLPWGNPYTIYRRGRCSFNLNWTARAISGGVWKDLTVLNLAPSRRIYLLLASYSDDPGATSYNISWGTKFTCINDI